MSIDRWANITELMDKKGTTIEKEMIRQYQKSLKEVRAMVSTAYYEYGADGVLTFDEMSKFNRLASLEKQIANEIARLTGKKAKTLSDGLFDIYKESYYRTHYLAELDLEDKGIYQALTFVQVDPDVIKKAIEAPIGGLTLPSRMEKHRLEIVWKLKEELTQGLIQGKSYEEMAEVITEKFNTDVSKALRVVRTEVGRIRTEARMKKLTEAYEDDGIEMKKRWLSTLDKRTRDLHSRLDGKVVDFDKEFKIGSYSAEYPHDFGVAKMDVNCRCDVIPLFNEYQNPKTRSARNLATGKTENIKNMTYEEWAKKNGIAGF